jgi:hypothetical protein
VASPPLASRDLEVADRSEAKTSLARDAPALRELDSFHSDKKRYLSMRPIFSPIDEPEPWK